MADEEQENTEGYTIEDLENMSDEDFDKLSFDQIASADNENIQKGNDDEGTNSTKQDSGQDDGVEEGSNPEAGSTDGEDKAIEGEANESKTEVAEEPPTDSAKGGEDVEPLPLPDGVLEPLKVNNTEVPVNSIEELRTLAAKSIEQNERISTLQGNDRYIAALQEAGILNDDGINRLIALSRKDPKAVSKLISEMDNIDDLPDEEEIKDYQPDNVIPEEQEMEVKRILTSLGSSEVYDNLIDTLTNDLDEASQKSFYERPEGIKTLEEHMRTGVFDKVKTEVAKQKLIGNIDPSMPFIDAYKIVGTHMYQNSGSKESEDKAKKTTSKKASKSKPNTFQKEGSSKGSKIDELTLDDLDNMSDDEFLEKVGNLKL